MLHTIGSGCLAVQLPLEENCALMRELGFAEIDLLLVSGWAHVGTDEIARDFGGVCRRVERALARAQLRLGAVNAKYSIPLETEGEAAVQRDREALAVMEFMCEFGVERISIQPTLTHDQEALRAGYRKTVREVMRLWEKYAGRGLKLSLEPHTMSSFCFNAGLKDLRAELPDFPITFDPSHLLCEGAKMADVLWLIPGTAMVHMRDAAPGRLFVPYGQGELDVRACVKKMVDAGYNGSVAIEYIQDERPDDATLENLFLFKEALDCEIRNASKET